MRQRLIDGALLAGLVVVAFAIMWTLFTLGRDRPPSPAATPDPIVADDGIETLDPADPPDAAADGATGDPIVPLDPSAAGAGDGSGGAGSDAAAVPDDATEDTTADASAGAAATEPAPLEPLPPGDVQLERVGFSFVTGGAGACGVVLEPWQHVAVSRDILAELGCGASVTVTLDDETGGRRVVDAVVADTMNPVHSRTVNIYVGEDEPALEYGVTAGVLER